jgi:molybdenum-dependent DNA-binding transcriptional regulator ModE
MSNLPLRSCPYGIAATKYWSNDIYCYLVSLYSINKNPSVLRSIHFIDIEQARTFLAITAYGSFLEAARQLHLTQSTVSARIQRLEEELGTRLFVRNRSGASLTQAGRRFLEHAKRLVLTAEQVLQGLRELAQQQ